MMNGKRLLRSGMLTVFLFCLVFMVGRAVDSDAIIITDVGSGATVNGPTYAGDGTNAQAANLNSPTNITLDSAGHLLIADQSNHVIRRVDANTKVITTVAGVCVPDPNVTNRVKCLGGYDPGDDGGPASAARLNNPADIALDSGGNLYIADKNNACIRRVDADTEVITTYAGACGITGDGLAPLRFNGPNALLFDGADNLYIADTRNNRIVMVTPGGAAFEVAAVSFPMSLAFDNAGILHVAAFNGHTIEKVENGSLTTVAGDGSAGSGGDGGLATSAQLDEPTGIAFDSADNLYIADYNNQRVRRVDAVTGFISTVAGDGTNGFAGDGDIATAAQFSFPWGIAVVDDETLLVVDNGNHRVRRIFNGPLGVLSNTTLEFGTPNIGSSNLLQATLTNTGNRTLNITDIAADNGASEFERLTGDVNDCAVGSYASGVSCTLRVNFTPVEAGLVTDSLIVTTNGNPVTLALRGSGTGSYVSLSRSAVDFGDQRATTTSAVETVTLTNTGDSDLLLTGIEKTAGGADFTLLTGNASDCTPGTLDIALSCAIRVSFNPQTQGAKSGNIRITSDSTPATVDLPLAGNGVLPALTITPSALSFGEGRIGTSSPAQTVTIANGSGLDATLSGVSIAQGTADYTILTGALDDCTVGVLPAGTDCKVRVVFVPDAQGERSGVLRVVSDAAGSPFDVVLSGTGTNVTLVRSEMLLDFGMQPLGVASTPLVATLTNTGNTAAQISLSLSVATDYALLSGDPNDCGAGPLAPSAACNIRVQFKPIQAGSRTATVIITSPDLASSLTVALNGSGTGAPVVSLSPAALPFGNQAVGVDSALQTVTLTNTGNQTLNISGISVSSGGAHFERVVAYVWDCTVQALAPDESCEINVRFTPGSLGTKAGALRIASDAPNAPHFVTLSGTGTEDALPTVTFSPPSLDFGGQPVNTTSPVQTVTVTNSGDAILSIGEIFFTGASNFFDRLSGQPGDCAVQTLRPAESCNLRLTFRPRTADVYVANLGLFTNTTEQQVDLPLRGTGLGAPVAAFSTTQLDFGTHSLGTTSDPRTVTLTNTGTVALMIEAMTVSDGFTRLTGLADDCVLGELFVGASCQFRVSFTPTAETTYNGTLTLTSNTETSPDVVALTGRGTTVTVADAPTGLMVSGDLDAAPVVPTLHWTHRDSPTAATAPGTYYGVYIGSTGDWSLYEWFPVGEVCSGVICTLSLDGWLESFGLLSDSYTWYVGAYLPDGQQVWSNAGMFNVVVPPAVLPVQVTTEPRNGRPVIRWDDDLNTMWVHLYVGNGGDYDYVGWHGRDETNGFTCIDGICSAEPLLNAPNGTYQIWMTAWGPGGYSQGGTSGWARGDDLVYALPAAGLPADFQRVSANTFRWRHTSDSVWFHLVITDAAYNVLHDQWHDAGLTGCPADGDTCEITLSGASSAAYAYVAAWGPGGLSTGGVQASGYAEFVLP